jgi:hypothetical protein
LLFKGEIANLWWAVSILPELSRIKLLLHYYSGRIVYGGGGKCSIILIELVERNVNLKFRLGGIENGNS